MIPLGQTHNHASSKDYLHKKFVFALLDFEKLKRVCRHVQNQCSSLPAVAVWVGRVDQYN